MPKPGDTDSMKRRNRGRGRGKKQKESQTLPPRPGSEGNSNDVSATASSLPSQPEEAETSPKWTTPPAAPKEVASLNPSWRQVVPTAPMEKEPIRKPPSSSPTNQETDIEKSHEATAIIDNPVPAVKVIPSTMQEEFFDAEEGDVSKSKLTLSSVAKDKLDNSPDSKTKIDSTTKVADGPNLKTNQTSELSKIHLKGKSQKYLQNVKTSVEEKGFATAREGGAYVQNEDKLEESLKTSTVSTQKETKSNKDISILMDCKLTKERKVSIDDFQKEVKSTGPSPKKANLTEPLSKNIKTIEDSQVNVAEDSSKGAKVSKETVDFPKTAKTKHLLAGVSGSSEVSLPSHLSQCRHMVDIILVAEYGCELQEKIEAEVISEEREITSAKVMDGSPKVTKQIEKTPKVAKDNQDDMDVTKKMEKSTKITKNKNFTAIESKPMDKALVMQQGLDLIKTTSKDNVLSNVGKEIKTHENRYSDVKESMVLLNVSMLSKDPKVAKSGVSPNMAKAIKQSESAATKQSTDLLMASKTAQDPSIMADKEIREVSEPKSTVSKITEDKSDVKAAVHKQIPGHDPSKVAKETKETQTTENRVVKESEDSVKAVSSNWFLNLSRKVTKSAEGHQMAKKTEAKQSISTVTQQSTDLLKVVEMAENPFLATKLIKEVRNTEPTVSKMDMDLPKTANLDKDLSEVGKESKDVVYKAKEKKISNVAKPLMSMKYCNENINDDVNSFSEMKLANDLSPVATKNKELTPSYIHNSQVIPKQTLCIAVSKTKSMEVSPKLVKLTGGLSEITKPIKILSKTGEPTGVSPKISELIGVLPKIPGLTEDAKPTGVMSEIAKPIISSNTDEPTGVSAKIPELTEVAKPSGVSPKIVEPSGVSSEIGQPITISSKTDEPTGVFPKIHNQTQVSANKEMASVSKEQLFQEMASVSEEEVELIDRFERSYDNCNRSMKELRSLMILLYNRTLEKREK